MESIILCFSIIFFAFLSEFYLLFSIWYMTWMFFDRISFFEAFVVSCVPCLLLIGYVASIVGAWQYVSSFFSKMIVWVLVFLCGLFSIVMAYTFAIKKYRIARYIPNYATFWIVFSYSVLLICGVTILLF